MPKPDIVVVPGGVGTRALLKDEAILEWLRKVYLCLSLMFLLLFGNGIKSRVVFRSGITGSPFFASDDGFLFFVALLWAKEKKF